MWGETMLLWGKGRVTQIVRAKEEKQIVELLDDYGSRRLAMNFPILTGECFVGDEVLFNKTAVELELGTGGYDFIIANMTHPPIHRKKSNEHIMKNRYTPLQFSVNVGEEKLFSIFEEDEFSLQGFPVFIICLHSMLPILCLTLKSFEPHSKIIYVMTDATSLPIWLSDHVEALKEKNLLQGSITIGQSFGGDMEAVNKFSGLLLGMKKYNPDYMIIGPGPGSVGTGSKWGNSGVEIGELVNAVSILGGKPIVVPRISFQDQRPRHKGLSHHIITALSHVALSRAILPVPMLSKEKDHFIYNQLDKADLIQKHSIYWIPIEDVQTMKEKMKDYPIKITTMGRTIDEDTEYFQGIYAAALYVQKLS